MMRILAIILELIGIAAIGTGIGVELTIGADIGFVAITVGSLMVAAGGVVWGKFLRPGGNK
jgi:hypothetical protein